MTIREQLEHAMKYRYPVRVETQGGSINSGAIDLISGDTCRVVEPAEGSGRYFHIPAITSVEIACDDSPYVEVSEIGSDEKWESGDEPRWGVYELKCSDRGKLESYRIVGQFAEEKDAKAIATLPDLVRQRDKLLEAAKAMADYLRKLDHEGWLHPEGRNVSTGNSLVKKRIELYKTIAKIEKNPLIRLTDNK